MKTIVITGTNRGIGLALAREYVTRGDRVIAVCRTVGEKLEALGVHILDGIDVTSDKDVRALPARLRDIGVEHIDVLINNAGILERQTLDTLDAEAISSMRRQFEVNALAPLRLCTAVHSMLGAGSKIAIITSRMGSLADNTSGGQYGYRMSKAAVNMAGRSLAHDLAPQDIAVALIHPGYVRTDMTGGQGLIDAPVAAGGIANVIDTLGQNNTGRFWHSDGSELPW